MEETMLIFKMENVYYGIPVEKYVKEIAMFKEEDFKRTVETEENVIGSIIIRDKMIGVIDLKERYGIKKGKGEKSIVVLKKDKTEKELVSLLIEDKLDIKEINVENIEKKENKIKEFYGYVKTEIEGKKEFLIILEGSKFFEKKEK